MVIARATIRGLALASGLLAAGGAGAVELELEGRFGAGYDTNIFGGASDAQGGAFLRFQPSATLDSREGTFRWYLNYQPYYLYYPAESEASGWSHVVNGRVEWRATPQLNFVVQDRFARVDSLIFFQDVVAGDEIVDVPEVPESEFGTRRLKRNNFTANANYALEWDKNLSFSVEHLMNDFSEETSRDNELLRISGRYLQSLGLRNRLGGGVAWSQNEIDGAADLPDLSSTFLNVFGSWEHLFDPTLTLSVTVGPAWVEGDELAEPPDVLPDRGRFVGRNTPEGIRLLDASTCPTVNGAMLLDPDCDVVPAALRPEELADLFGQQVDLARVGDSESSSGGSLTYFADVSLEKRWQRIIARLSYRRQEATSFSSFGASTVADILSLDLRWTASRKLTFDLRGQWVRRDQESEVLATEFLVGGTDVNLPCPRGTLQVGAQLCVGVNNAGQLVAITDRPLALTNVAEQVGYRTVTVDRTLQEDQWIARLRANYRLTRRVDLSGTFSYIRIDREADFPVVEPRDRYVFSVNLIYRFDPIHL